MGKQIKLVEYYELFRKYESLDYFWKYYFSEIKTKIRHTKGMKNARYHFQKFYKKYGHLSYNEIMKINLHANKKGGSGRKPKVDNSDLPDLISQLTREQLEEVANRYFERLREEKTKDKVEESNKLSSISICQKANLFKYHRSTPSKTRKQRVYILDKHSEKIKEIFQNSNGVYGRERIAAELKNKHNIEVSIRTLGNWMNRNDLICKIRKPRMARERKNTNVKYTDLVKRNFNPVVDNIKATDVTYIRANVPGNFVFLSAIISHKTKFIESFVLSKANDLTLVKETIEQAKWKDGDILHSDHGFQYSHHDAMVLASKNKYKISMARVGNSLDNREIEYFFSCLKSECLYLQETAKMSFEEIKEIIEKYIKWYNHERINKKIKWLTPANARVSQYM